jgi:hypothetical protein
VRWDVGGWQGGYNAEGKMAKGVAELTAASASFLQSKSSSGERPK